MTIGTQDPMQRLNDEMAGVKRQLGEFIVGQARVDFRLDRLETATAGLRADVNGLKPDVSGLKADVNGLKADVNGLKADVRGLKADVAGLKADMTVVKADVAELKADLTVVKADVTGLKADITVVKADVAELKVAVVATDDRLTRFERATERRFNRVDARLEQLITLVQHAETRKC